MSNIQIRQLSSEDIDLWKTIRLEALQDTPEAFGSSFEEEQSRSVSEWETSLEESDVFGLFLEDSLVAIAGFFTINMQKMKHRGVLFSVYVQPEYRGKGFSKQLVSRIIEHARDKAIQLHCTVITNNEVALNLYKKFGFEVYGTEPRALKVGGEYFDEHLLVLRLDKS